MQLGELQHQLARFERREVEILALSVDEPEASLAMIDRLGLAFALGSDPEQSVIQAYQVQNPDTRELAIHAVYIIASDGEIYYRKVGRRRPVSQELIDAIDAHRGDYPRNDEAVEPRVRAAVAYPQNEFQGLLTVSKVHALPPTIDPVAFADVRSTLAARNLDDALIAYQRLLRESPEATEADLLDSAAWLTRTLYFQDDAEALTAGAELERRLKRIRSLEAELEAASNADEKDELLHTLARARAGLTLARNNIDRQADAWRLASVKTTLRSYREVARAEQRYREAL
ncbi:MAG: redoxin domain-containing protein [Pseudomonadota bacterium]